MWVGGGGQGQAAGIVVVGMAKVGGQGGAGATGQSVITCWRWLNVWTKPPPAPACKSQQVKGL